MNFKYKNSTKNNLAPNLLLVMISAVLTFMGAKVFGTKIGVVVFAIAIAVCFYKIAIEAIEKLIGGKFHYTLLCLASVLLIFASQKFLISAIVAMVLSLSFTIYDAINSLISRKVLQEDENKLTYEILVEDELKTVFAEDLKQGDLVKVQQGDYLAFDYIFMVKEDVEKTLPAGNFNFATTEDTFVKVQAVVEYDIDLEESENVHKSSVLKLSTTVVNIYTYLVIAFAVFMTVKDFLAGKIVLQSLYILGVYLLFANPLVVNSGVFAAGILSLKELKKKGLSLKNIFNLEKLSGIKKLVFTKELATDDQTKLKPEFVKAVKVADVLGIETDVLGEDDCCVCDNCACVTSQERACECSTVISTENKSAIHICKDKIFEIARAIKYSSFFKWFTYLRLAFGVVVNTGVLALFSTNKVAKMLADKLIETDAITFKGKVLTALVQYDMLTPWIICAVQLILVNLLLFATLAFLSDDKKLD